jgi:hypothetical protein
LGNRGDHDRNITATHPLASCKNLAALAPVFCSTNIKQRPKRMKKDGSTTTRCWRQRLFPYLITLQTRPHQENTPVEEKVEASGTRPVKNTHNFKSCFRNRASSFSSPCRENPGNSIHRKQEQLGLKIGHWKCSVVNDVRSVEGAVGNLPLQTPSQSDEN